MIMLKRLKEKLKKRWKEFLGKEGRVPTTFKKTIIDITNHNELSIIRKVRFNQAFW
ncbi:hypothetical protein CV093_08905 [Oceanobacillus sp. 143]|nr:hypothetical protein CV093_08905 [Oceanobacillus sp. 143]